MSTLCIVARVLEMCAAPVTYDKDYKYIAVYLALTIHPAVCSIELTRMYLCNNGNKIVLLQIINIY